MDQRTDKVKTDHLEPDRQPVPMLYWVFSPERQIVEDKPVELRPGATIVGSTTGPEQRIEIPKVRGISRNHATLNYDEARRSVTLTDQSSYNSTWVNGKRLVAGEPTTVGNSDVIRLGDAVFVLVLAAKPSSPVEKEALPEPPKLLGRSPLIEQLRRDLVRLARAGQLIPVLLLGEPGTGKERAAEEFHRASGRKKYVTQDCGALTLPESTLFGHVRGAFSGAVQAREGLLSAAHNGTLFLDEVGNLTLELQQKLLRVLAERKVHRMGEEEKPGKQVDVLLIAATNRPLVQDAHAGSFRLDLFRRLTGVVLRLPPLRSRREDILFLLRHASSPGGADPPKLPELNTTQVELLLLHDWPGNVGDLLNVRGHLCALGFDDNLRQRLSQRSAADVRIASPASPPSAEPEDRDSDEQPREPRPDATRLAELLRKHEGKLLAIERDIGWSRRTLGDLVKKYQLEHLRKS